MKLGFFDRSKVIAAMDAKTRKALSKMGAFVRTRARSLIRRRKGSSAPGRPPHGHAGTLKQFLYFAYDQSRRSVVVGPALTNQVSAGGDGRPVRGTVPEVLETGGQVGIFEVFQWGRWRRADLRSRRRNASLPTRLRHVHIAARPFMGPALAAEREKFASLWAAAA